jgi:hypothetical protein
MSELRVRGSFGVREGLLAKEGDSTVTHEHNFDHITYLLGKGAVETLEPTKYDPETNQAIEFRLVGRKEFVRGGWATIEAHKFHRIVALEDGVQYHCLFLHRTPDGQISPSYEGAVTAYE